MAMDFSEKINQGYNFSRGEIIIGKPIFDNKIITDLTVKIPTSTLNRHGLIAGATGTGKTKTIQKFLEQLSKE